MSDGAVHGYEALGRALRAESDAIFGIMGHATASTLVAYIGSGGRFVSARHENAAVNMADGWARATGAVGVASVTVGPGLTQIGTALVTAARSGTPLVVFVGDLPWSDPARHQHAFDHAPFVKAAEALFVPVLSAASLHADVAEAFYLARSRRTAVVLDVPIPVQEALVETSHYRPLPNPAAGQRYAPDPAVVASLAARLMQAKRPILVAGRGAASPGTRDAIRALAERTGALLATSLLAKGLFDGDPWDIGIAGNYCSRTAQDLFAGADLVLAFGTSLHRHSTRDGTLYGAAQVVRIDDLPAPRVPDRPGWLYVRGDAGATAEALARHLGEGDASRQEVRGYRTHETAASLRDGVDSRPVSEFVDGIDPRDLMAQLTDLLPERAVIVTSGGHSAAFPAQYLAGPPRASYHFAYAFGAIGQALGMAIGTALGDPDRRSVLIDGDGSLLMVIGELDTAARERLPLLVIVLNDAAFGAEYHQLRAHGMSPESATFEPRSFAAIARALGADGCRVTRVDDVAPAIETGLAADGPYVVDVAISRAVVSDAYRRLHFNQESAAPHLGRPLPSLVDP